MSEAKESPKDQPQASQAAKQESPINDQQLDPEALCSAASRGVIEEVRALLDHKVDVNGQDEFGMSALHWAAYEGYADIVTLLLDRGADINTRDRDFKQTPLHKAAKNKTATVALLLDRGADIHAEDDTGSSALHEAAKGRTETLRLLLTRGAKVNAPNNHGCTALHKAARFGDIASVQYLLAYGADPRLEDNERRKAAFYAHIEARADYIIAFERAQLAQRANQEAQLRSAANKNEINTLRKLLQQGVDIHAQDEYGDTALHLAAKQGHIASVRYLLAKGANPNLLNHAGRTAASYASPEIQELINNFVQAQPGQQRHDLAEVRDLLRRVDASSGQPVFPAEAKGNHAVAYGQRAILEQVMDLLGEDIVSIPDQFKLPPDSDAAAEAKEQKQRQPDPQNQALRTDPPLHQAVRDGDVIRIVRLLLLEGADIQAPDRSGNAALQIAIATHQPTIATLLLAHGANINAQDQLGQTALHTAAVSNNLDSVELLLSKGADPNLRDVLGETAASYSSHAHIRRCIAMAQQALPTLEPSLAQLVVRARRYINSASVADAKLSNEAAAASLSAPEPVDAPSSKTTLGSP